MSTYIQAEWFTWAINIIWHFLNQMSRNDMWFKRSDSASNISGRFKWWNEMSIYVNIKVTVNTHTHSRANTLTCSCCPEAAVPCACSGGRSLGSRYRKQPCPLHRLPRHHTWWCSPWSHHPPQETECPVSAFATIARAPPPLSNKREREKMTGR